MNSPEFETLQSEVDGVAYAFMLLLTRLETQGLLDGPGYSQELLCFADIRLAVQGCGPAARVMRRIATELDKARAERDQGGY